MPAAVESFPDDDARINEIGRPFIRNFAPKEYGAAPSNWAIVQDQRGVMYFGNAEGVLEYDGLSWRRIATPNRTVVRSLALGLDGRIYVGEVGAFGYLAPSRSDGTGHTRFVSLLALVPPENRKFADVWNTRVTNQGIYFTTYNTLFRYTPRALPDQKGKTGGYFHEDEQATGDMRVWKAQTRFQLSFVVRDTLYVDQKDFGLMQMVDDSLRLVPGGERFAAQRIYVMLPYNDHQILIGTMGHGLFLYDGIAFHPFPTAVDSFLIQNQLYQGLALPNGTFVLATIRGGVVIIDRQGHLLQQVDKTSGLQDSFVLALHADQQGGLWMGLFNGLARVETPAPLSLFGEESGLRGSVIAIIRHQGTLYVATSLGVFYLKTDKFHAAAFQPLAGIATQCWSFLSHGHDLLVATNEGVYRISKNKITNLGFEGATVLRRSQQDSNKIFVGMTFGLASLRWNKGKWINAGKMTGIEEEVRSIAEDEHGTLWLGTKSQGTLRMASPALESARATPRIERFGAHQGLPDGEINVYAIGKRLFFATGKGLYRYDEVKQRFLPDSTFGMAFADGRIGVDVLASDKQGNVWLVAKQETGDEINLLMRQRDDSTIGGTFQRIRTPFLRVPKTALWAVYPDVSGQVPEDHAAPIRANGVVWYGGAEGLVRYDPNVRKDYEAPYSALIRRVTIGEDSVIYYGNDGRAGLVVPAISYAQNALGFEFASTSYDDPAENQYQSMLEGLDNHWSIWSKETRHHYANLPFGDYRFRVRAKNIYQHVSQEAVYAFKILPPWYRTWWAYGIYGFILAASIYTIDRIQRRRLIKKERARAEAERKELELKKAEELRIAYERLTETHEHLKATQQQLVMQEKLASLGALTAGIAHEIRNPLNFVNNFAALAMGLVKELEEELAANQDKNIADLREKIETLLVDLKQLTEKINHHGKRADSIVKSMIQHARSSSGQREPADINQLLDEAVNLVYHGLRANDASFNISIEKEYDESIGKLSVVPQDISRVFLNIINNACYAAVEKQKANSKTQMAGFSPTLSLSTKRLNDKIEIRIRDNGNGIPLAIREKIFNPFFTTKPTGQGTGLGLSISYDIIVQQHKGEIKVETEEGKFTEFVVRLPRT